MSVFLSYDYIYILCFFNAQIVLIGAIGGPPVAISQLGEALSRTLFGLLVFLIPPFYRRKDSLTYFTVLSYDYSIQRAF